MAAEPVQELVERLLDLLGVSHVAAEPGLVRVYRHPELGELLGDGERWDLALTPEALHEHPAALPCTPGSFVLDGLLRRAGELPGAFCTELQAAASAGGTEPGLEGANAALTAGPDSPGERRVLYGLFRVQVQTDELREQLVGVVVDEEGRPRPGREATAETAQRRAGRTAGGVPDAAWDGLLREAAEQGRGFAVGLAPAIEARKAAEIARLEAYHRALRDDLQTEVPAGPGRRAAQIEAEGRALVDTARSLLSGDGPWTREALTHPLRRGGGWGGLFGKKSEPAPLPVSLDAETAAKLKDLGLRLEEPFTFDQVEQMVGLLVERRLERLEHRAAEGPSPRELLAEREASLAAEHRSRLEEIERRYAVQVLVRPAFVEWLTYPAVLRRHRLAGSEAALDCVWHGLTGTWELPDCPSCRSPVAAAETAARVWLCENGHVACGTCVSNCRGCGRARCRACAFPACGRCALPACEACGVRCSGCGGWHCAAHASECPNCAGRWCAACGGACVGCGAALCREHFPSCSFCEGKLCAAHAIECAECRRTACLPHGGRCAACGLGFCEEHSVVCTLCCQDSCRSCIGERGRCETCRSLVRAGAETVAALQAWFAEADPGFDASALRNCRTAAGERVTVVVARRWPWDHVVVLDNESRALIKRMRRWFWMA